MWAAVARMGAPMASLGNPYGLGRADPSFREGIQIRVANGRPSSFRSESGPPPTDKGRRMAILA